MRKVADASAFAKRYLFTTSDNLVLVAAGDFLRKRRNPKVGRELPFREKLGR